MDLGQGSFVVKTVLSGDQSCPHPLVEPIDQAGTLILVILRVVRAARYSHNSQF